MLKFKTSLELLQHFDIRLQKVTFFQYKNIASIPLNEVIAERLNFFLANQGEGDKENYKSDFLIVPFLGEAWIRHPKLYLFSHPNLKAGEFNLYPDYLVTGRNKTGVKVVRKPLLLTVEAENETVEQGWFEAAQQAIAAQIFNKDVNIPVWIIVATGDLWYFGKLDGKTMFRHPSPLSIAYPDILLGVLTHLFGECEKYADK